MEMIPKNWLITGGCGFLGTSLIAHLLKNVPASHIRVLDNLSVGSREDLAEVCSFIEVDASRLTPHDSPGSTELLVGDIRDAETCLKVCQGMDAVVHLAANTGVGPSVENPRADMESNVIGIFNMLEAARTYKVDKFVFASSGAPIGEVEPPIHEEKAPRPVSPYGASKLAGEGYCSSYFRTFGVKTVSLRFGNVYGPRSKHKNSVVAKFFKQALAGETLEIYGDGNQTRDFIYIDDLIQAICLAVNPMPKVSRDLSHVSPYGEVFQIATHKETTVNEITEEIKVLVERQTGKKVVVKYGEARLGDVKRNFSDISKAKRLLGFEPVFDLPKGLMKTLEYFTVRKA
jgi:UDP-glucose 4-epimerase